MKVEYYIIFSMILCLLTQFLGQRIQRKLMLHAYILQTKSSRIAVFDFLSCYFLKFSFLLFMGLSIVLIYSSGDNFTLNTHRLEIAALVALLFMYIVVASFDWEVAIRLQIPRPLSGNEWQLHKELTAKLPRHIQKGLEKTYLYVPFLIRRIISEKEVNIYDRSSLDDDNKIVVTYCEAVRHSIPGSNSKRLHNLFSQNLRDLWLDYYEYAHL